MKRVVQGGLILLAGGVCIATLTMSESKASATSVTFPSPAEVRILEGPFADALRANQAYLLALDPDRLLAPFLREAGVQPKARPYENWESGGLDGHTAGHYLSALALMVAAGADTPSGELKTRLEYMVNELARCQEANGDGYVGGVPGSKELWRAVAAGRVEAVHRKWVPWYNLHKTFAGLRDVYLFTSNQLARQVLVRLADWCETVTAKLTEEQMQRMLDQEHGGMNEVLADVYAITGDEKYLRLAQRFCHRAVLEPLKRHEDRLTGLHANTQIPKVAGLARLAMLTGDRAALSGARFFWENVVTKRSVAFGGNSVSEHFNDPKDFRRMLEHREGPETCNTYNMLRLTRLLFAMEPDARYADFYERALFNHILASINPDRPGYVYFTPIRPQHYRVYSQPDKCFWCCVGTGMENPGRYGEFIYALGTNNLYVNLFIHSELAVPALGLKLRQVTKFPDEPRTCLELNLQHPAEFTIYIRHPWWVASNKLVIRINGRRTEAASNPSSYVKLQRRWRDGDRIEVELPMHTSVERLPDGSPWVAILHGPIVLAAPSGTNDMLGLFADGSRMGHVAHGPLVPLDKVPVLLAAADEVPKHVRQDPSSTLKFELLDIVEPPALEGIPLVPFFRLHAMRYQIYWQLTTREELAARRERLASEERARAAREAATVDWVAVGEQQSEVEHGFKGEDTETGIHEGRRWRHGRWFQYTLDTKGEKDLDLVVTYWGGDSGRVFDIFVNGRLLATEELRAEQPGRFFERRYRLPAEVLTGTNVTVKFEARQWVAGGVFDLRLMRQLGTGQPGS